jgi:hypothetical protein
MSRLALAMTVIVLAAYGLLAAGEMNLSGTTQMRYVDESGEDSGFGMKSARVKFTARLTDRISIKTQADFAGEPELLDAEISYALSPRAVFTFGQFKVPFGLEPGISPFNLETLNRSLVTGALFNNGLKTNYLRDRGAMLSGRRKLIEYRAAVINGSGYNYASGPGGGSDNNNSRDFAGRLGLGIPMFAGLGFSYYRGRWGPDEDRTAMGFDLFLDTGKVLYQMEYISGEGRLVEAGWSEAEYGGYWIVVGYRITPMIEPVFKFDRLDPDQDKDGDTRTDLYYGLALNFSGRGRLQAIYRENSVDGEYVGDAFLVQVSAQLPIGP